MEQKYHELSMAELCELLIQRTEKLILAIETSPDGFALRDLRMEVDEIQSEIRKRKKMDE